MPRCRILLVVVLLWGVVSASSLAATITEQRRELSRASTAIRTSERMARAGRVDEAVAAFAEAQESLGRAANGLDQRLERSFERGKEKLAELHAQLTQAGLSPPPLAAMSTTPATLGDGPEATQAPAGSVSFVEHVVPILTNRCGGCHVTGNRGNVSFATYNIIVEGAPSGRYVEVGSGMESLLIDVIVSGSMPPNGNTVPPAEVRTLLEWINEGARFDGDNPAKPLGQLQKGEMSRRASDDAEISQPPSQSIPQPTGNETVSFAVDIAPLLTESCSECHGSAGERAGFSVANFQRLWAGGNSGAAIVPGDAKQSLLVQKLHGTADGARMPQNRPAWPAGKIALVEKWINEGATFDGPSAEESLARVAALVRTARATPEQLSADREQTALQQWRLAIPDEQASTAASTRFLVVGNSSEAVLGRLAAAAEGQAGGLLDWFKQSGEPLSKGRVTLFAFAKRIDYSEFGTMVERRGLPADSSGHAPLRHGESLRGLGLRWRPVAGTRARVGDQSGQTVRRRPRARSTARVVHHRRRHGDCRAVCTPRTTACGSGETHCLRRLRRLATRRRLWMVSCPPKQTDLLAFGFVDALLQKPGNFNRLVKAAADRGDFAQACQQTFKRSPPELAALWAATVRRGQ